ncbi:MAG: 1-acyl-sn-glycerol-3-phosphate acyltransferase [Nocardioidaceae bacterium]|nr:1-acyl-sn-glycerol-3-phosphate acyltransferase [Nocardioidaceae bacterium]
MLYAAMRSVIAPTARLVYRPYVEGAQHVPRHGAVILASNHLSFIDSVVIPIVAPRPVIFLAKAEYFTGTGITGAACRAWFTAIGSIPIERGDNRAALASLDAALGVLRKGEAFGIYPEGTRSRDGRLYRGRTGVGWLALTAKVPVVPVALIGTDKIQPVGSRMPRLHRITVRFGEPLVFDGTTTSPAPAKARREATDKIMAAIAALSPQELAGVYNESPPVG